MRRLLVIGIGAGDPEHVTAQAIRALNAVDVFFVVEKGEEKHDLVDLRREICERYIESPSYRTVELRDPERDRTSAAYGEAVEAWRHARAAQWEASIRAELGETSAARSSSGAIPRSTTARWPSSRRSSRGASSSSSYEVVPGISSVQALAARHRIALNRIGQPVVITTGRRLAEGLHDAADDIVVMLDAGCAFRRFAGQPVDIYWGAYIGTPDELLVAGDRRRGGGRDRARARRGARAQGLDHGHVPAASAQLELRLRVRARRIDARPSGRVAQDARLRRPDEDERAHVDGAQVEIGERRDRQRLLVAADGPRQHDGRLGGAMLQQYLRARSSASRRVCEAGL